MESRKYLGPLLEGTPLAIERIKLAWPSLSISDRAYLLVVMLADASKEKNALRWPHHRKCLVDLALADENPYIRYLASKGVSEPCIKSETTPDYQRDKARFEKILSDPVPLVRLANKEDDWGHREFDNPELFWNGTQTERLTLVNGVEEDGEKIAELFRYGTRVSLPAGTVTLEEMVDVLLQYTNWKRITERVADSENYARLSFDGYAEFMAGKSVKALWEVIPDIPKELSYILIDYLPERAGLSSGIPPQVIESLDERQLARLLYRDDISLKELRRKLYKESTNDSLRCAALTSHHFRLSDSDISDLIYDPGESKETGKKKIDELAMLARYCRGATLVQMRAICDLIEDAPDDFHTGLGQYDAVESGEGKLTQQAKRLSSKELEREVIAMRLFALARELAPIKTNIPSGSLPEKLNEHEKLIVAQNPWQTYLNLSKVVRLDRWKQAIGYLPSVSIPDANLFKGEPEDELEDETVNRVVQMGIAKLLKRVNFLLWLISTVLLLWILSKIG